MPGGDGARLTRALVSRLDDDLEALDPDVGARLAAARRRAMRVHRARPGRVPGVVPWRGIGSAILAGGVAAGIVLVPWSGRDRIESASVRTAQASLAVQGSPVSDAATRAPMDEAVDPLDDLALLASVEELDFYRSVDLLLWLEGGHD